MHADENPKEVARLAELGRIFEEFADQIVQVEKRHLDKASDRTAGDIRLSVLEILQYFSTVFERAGPYLSDASKFEGIRLPWPLLVAEQELKQLHTGARSPIFSTDNDGKPLTGKRGRIPDHTKAQAIAASESLVNDYGCDGSNAAGWLAHCFAEVGLDYKSKQIIEWVREASRSSNSYSRQLSECLRHQRDYFSEIKALRGELSGGCTAANGSLEVACSVQPPQRLEDGLKSQGIVAEFRRILRGTHYKTPRGASCASRNGAGKKRGRKPKHR